MNTIRAGVIGTGFIGPAHIEALRRTPGVDVVAIASNEPERARAIADRFGITRVYDSWQSVMSDREVEVVHNCTPNHLHFEINKAAVLAGKHVVSEKPLTRTSKESETLLALARKKGIVHAINFNYRFYPLIQHARALARRGELGKIYLVHGHYLQDWLFYDTDYNWRLDPEIGGASRAVADIGSHWCDLVQFVTGQRITKVCAELVTFHKTRRKPAAVTETFKGKEAGSAKGIAVPVTTEDAGVILLNFDGGARGAVTVSQVSAGRKNREWFEIDGSTQAIAWDQEDPNRLWFGRRDGANEVLIKDPSLLDESARRYAHYPGGHPEGYPEGPKNLFMNVYEFIRAGKNPLKDEMDFPTWADGHWENRIVEAVVKSSKSRKWVDVTL
ncbi:MAG: Gfo/Idh/MocA family oxidoreductase [Bacteroidota bacterium]